MFTILDSIPSQIAVLDTNGVVLHVNSAWMEFARHNDGPDTLTSGLGTNYLEICTRARGRGAGAAAAVCTGIRAVLSGQQAMFSLEFSSHSPTEKRWFLMTVSPIKNTDGHVLVSNLNITELKLAELRRTSLDAIVEQSVNEIYVFDEETLHFIHMNQAALKNLDYNLSEIRAITPIDIKPEFTPASFATAIQPLRDGEKIKIDFTTVHQRKDGTTYPVEVHVQRGTFDTTSVFFAVILDITERTQTEDALAQSRLFLESAPDATLIMNERGRIEIANTQTSNLLGYTPDELRGMPVDTLVPERFRDGHAAHRAAFTANPNVRGMGAELELYAVAKDGQEIPIEVSLSPIKTRDGLLVSASIRDVTERQQREEELRLAKDEAERATIGKSRFLAAASHDLRQPLQAINMYLSVLNRLHDQPKQIEVGDKISNSLDTMSELLNALLDISKLDSGSVVPEKRDLPMRDLLDRIVGDNIQQAEKKGLTLDWSCEDCTVHSDPALLTRVIENYVTNAIRYTDTGNITIRSTCVDGQAHVEVTDTGIGMPQESLDKVFDEYYQLDNAVRDRRKGLGLGLSIVKHIARLLEHPLRVLSVEGRGSTFSVDIPLSTESQSAIAAREPLPAEPRGDRVAVVLFVDDDPAVVDATTMMLDAMGLEVHSALNGDEALMHLSKGVQPDIVVSDYRLPGYDGLEVVRRVRAATVADLPSVLMTGDTSAKEIDAANLLNCTVLRKPVDTNRLMTLILDLTA